MKFLIINGTGLAVFAAGWVEGYSAIPFLEDQTYLTWFIGAVFLYGLFLASVGRWEASGWVGMALVHLGLVGTVLGFIIAFTGVGETANAGEVSEMIAALISGMGTAFHTTLVGAVGSLWLSLNRHLLDG